MSLRPALRAITPRLARTAVGTVFDFGRGARNWLQGKPLAYPGFGSMTLDPEDIRFIGQSLKHPASWQDENAIEELHRHFANWNGSQVAFSFMGGRVALSAAIEALGIGAGDEVVIPAYTCIVVPNAFSYASIKIRYCDIELDTYGPDFDSVVRAVTSQTKAILIQHLYGLVCRDLERILTFARLRNLRVIEDCTHAMGASLRGRRVGNWGDVGFYSTEQSKSISTFNGGIAVTNDPIIAQRLGTIYNQMPYPSEERTRKLLINAMLCYRQHKDPARWWRYRYFRSKYGKDLMPSTSEGEMAGIRPYHYFQKMPSPLAALGLRQLKRLDTLNEQRRLQAARWADLLRGDQSVRLPMAIEDSQPVYLRYPVIVPEGRKGDTAWYLEAFGLLAEDWFIGELHPVPRPMKSCPNARYAVEHCINLPTLI